jgi:hypothetical protein
LGIGNIQTIPIAAAIIKASVLTEANIVVLPTALVLVRIIIYVHVNKLNKLKSPEESKSS